MVLFSCFVFFFFNDTATTEIYTLSLHDALPICGLPQQPEPGFRSCVALGPCGAEPRGDRKSTRLNSSHSQISYAVFWFEKKIRQKIRTYPESSNFSHAPAAQARCTR